MDKKQLYDHLCALKTQVDLLVDSLDEEPGNDLMLDVLLSIGYQVCFLDDVYDFMKENKICEKK